jgi:hypothetical protein
MLKNKRRRAVVLALIAFFCTAAATYVAVDWKRFGGGVLAFFKGGRDDQVATTGAGPTGSGAGHLGDAPAAPNNHASLPQVAAVHLGGAKHIASASGKVGDDLFVYGDPAAGIPPGSFLVASNETPPSVTVGGGEVPLPGTGTPAIGGAPAPAGAGAPAAGGGANPAASGGGGSGDNSFPTGTPTTSPTPAPSPGAPVPVPAPPTTPVPPPPTQSGSTDDPPPPPPSDGGSDPGSPVSSIPEASTIEMMALGTLFLAVAAQRKRKST